MTKAPLYKVPMGSRLILDGRHWLVTGREEDGYAVEGVEDGESTTLFFSRVDQGIKERTCEIIKPADAEMRDALLAFTGGFELFEQLPREMQDLVRTRLAVVLAMDALEEEGVKLTHANLDEGGQYRSTMLKRAKEISNGSKFLDGGASGKINAAYTCPSGRTLARYRKNYRRFGHNPVALMDREHLKGRRSTTSPRLSQCQERFIQYVIKLWNHPVKPKLALLVQDAKTLFDIPPEEIARGFSPPSITTIRARIKALSGVAKAIGRSGLRHATNLKGAGSTDIRALKYGEKVEMDQVYLSIFTEGNGVVRAKVIDPKTVPEMLADNEVRRLWMHAAFDVATRLPLAWIVSETADADHSHALLRMATRDKTREKVRYECKRDPAPGVGIMLSSADNGSATRNGTVYASQLGMGTTVMTARAYHATDKPFVERPFGTIQWQALNFHPGYTGSRPGELEGYDPKPSAKLSHDEIYGSITRYLVDEYSHTEHRGTGIFKATPWEKYEQARAVYGEIAAPSQEVRCLHLGVKVKASTTSEGVLAFNLPFNSTELQRFAGGASKKVTIHLDPDCLREVRITAEGQTGVMKAELSMTAFRDLSLEETIEIMEDACRRDPKAQEFHDQHLIEVRRRRAKESGFFPDPRDPSNYQTIDQLQRRADRLAQVSVRPVALTGPTAPPGHVTDRTSGNAVFKVRKSTAPAPDSKQDGSPASPPMTFKPIKESKL